MIYPTCKWRTLPWLWLLVLASAALADEPASRGQPASPLRPRLQRPSRSQQAASTGAPSPAGQGSAVEVQPPAALALAPAAQPVNRSARNLDVFKDGDGYNIFVTNTCERESMKVNVKTSRPFHGVIHTRNQRQKQLCAVKGTGASDYSLEISHVLNALDPDYCGVIKAHRESPDDKDTLSVVIAVRFHHNIELSDDKFFVLNCTNRCRRPDCSKPELEPASGAPDRSGRLTGEPAGEREGAESGAGGAARATNDTTPGQPGADECTVWKFPWLITLLWCMGILLLAMTISHCIMCSSLFCRCVRTEVEEREPSIYEGDSGASALEDDLYNKRHPYRIDYDNRDIYKTTNNYTPYSLEEVQAKSRLKQAKQSK